MYHPDERHKRVLYATLAALKEGRGFESATSSDDGTSITDAEVAAELQDADFSDQEVRDMLAVLAQDWLDGRVEHSSDGSVSKVVIHGIDPSRIEEGDI